MIFLTIFCILGFLLTSIVILSKEKDIIKLLKKGAFLGIYTSALTIVALSSFYDLSYMIRNLEKGIRVETFSTFSIYEWFSLLFVILVSVALLIKRKGD